jgi:hypothetical protein
VLARQRFAWDDRLTIVRWLGRALAGSVMVHAAIAVAAAWWHPRRDRLDVEALASTPDDASIEVSSSAPPAPVPIELVTLPPASAPPLIAPPPITPPAIAPPPIPPPPLPPAIASATPAPRAPAAPAQRTPPTGAATPSISTGATHPGGPEPSTGPTNATTDSGARLFAMRDPIRRPDAASVGAAVDEIAAQGKPPPPIPDSGRLEPHGSEARINDLTFTGKVDADGTVHIDDKPNFNAHIKVDPKAMGKAIANWAEDPYAYTKNLPQPGDMIEQAPRGDHVRVTATDQKADSGQTVALVGGGFDVTDWIARKALGKAKGDPYAARKLAALDATRDERVEMRRRHRNDQLDHADEIVRDSLDRLWASGASLADRKEALFELWDDCAESGDAPVVDAARRARNEIVGFVRAHLPAGSAEAFTPAELDTLNARRSSHARFAPYE